MSQTTTKEQFQVLLQRERQIADELRTYFLEFGRRRLDTSDLRQVVASLNDPFLLVVVGEFNAGKSACINKLLGKDLVASGALPTTNQIAIIRYAETEGAFEDAGVLYIQSTAEILQHYSIVDTPGSNAVLRDHQYITEDFIPRSDLIFFVTAADRPFADSERDFLERIRLWGKKIVIILNKIDHLDESASPQKTVDFVREKCKELLGFEPRIFPTSVRIAQQMDAAKSIREGVKLWKKSGFESVESYLLETLDDSERLRLKLLTPLNGMQRLLRQVIPIVDQHAFLLDDYNQSVNNIAGRLNLYREDMERDLTYCLSEVENIILEMRARGDSFVDEKMRIGNLLQWFRSKSNKEEFEHQVIGDSAERISDAENLLKIRFISNDFEVQQDIKNILDHLRATRNSFDRLVEHEHQFKQAILTELGQLNQISIQQDNEIIGSVDKQLEEDRNEIIGQVKNAGDGDDRN